MRTEPPADRLRRRLGRQPESDSAAPADDTDAGGDDSNSLLPGWLPDGSANDGWLDKVRADPGRSGAVALATIAAVAVLVTVFTVVRDRPQPVVSSKLPAVEMVSAATSADGPNPTAAADADPVVVSVVGLVHQPGLVTLTPGARVADALHAAGGALDGADTTGLNMARPLADGEQIVVGIATPAGQPAVLGSSVSDGPAGTETAAPTPAPAIAPAGPINLNTATAEQLDALPGVGPVTAAAIVAWRSAHGSFHSVDDLAEVDGIGPTRLEKLRPLVRV